MKITKLKFLVLSCCCIGCLFLSSSTTIDKDISLIRERYSQITQLKSKHLLEKSVIRYQCPDYPEEGTVTFYADHGEYRLVELSYSQGDHYGASEEYYIWDNQVFFYYFSSAIWSFDFSNSGDATEANTLDTFEENRVYFSEGKAIRCLKKNYEVRSTDEIPLTADKVANEAYDCFEGAAIINKYEQLLQLAESEDVPGCIWEEE